ncbi:hypothetical protein [Pontibacter cellulosilyticus]|uniref:Uncharacterized protein n=1 Tax=Pontibacter cellulosilyticus TaxID=1720253 RepID=A0A923N3V1_9BACT|nr:hypothetical protein [Pontibacter cellulosilyticus]MBC5992400.1 hypothetical protein [Pontibacter cellulosilyticus]
MITQSKTFTGIVLAVAMILAIPLIAMQFTDEVNWKLFDFILMGILLLSTGFAAEFAVRRIKNRDYHLLIIALILLAFFLVWAELAVGIFGTPFAAS